MTSVRVANIWQEWMSSAAAGALPADQSGDPCEGPARPRALPGALPGATPPLRQEARADRDIGKDQQHAVVGGVQPE